MINLICSQCKSSRLTLPSVAIKYKTTLCRKCFDGNRVKEKVRFECPRCHRVRFLTKIASKKYKEGYCRGCAGVYDKTLPDTYESGYITGAIIGDGYLYFDKKTKGKGLRLEVGSKNFADLFAKYIEKVIGRKPWRGVRFRNIKANPSIKMPETNVTIYIVSIGSVEWYEKLEIFKHQKKYTSIKKKGKGFSYGFLQGFLDAEGYINKKLRYIDFTNKDTKLLKLVEYILKKVNQKSYTFKGSIRNVYHLRCNIFLSKTT